MRSMCLSSDLRSTRAGAGSDCSFYDLGNAVVGLTIQVKTPGCSRIEHALAAWQSKMVAPWKPATMIVVGRPRQVWCCREESVKL